MTTPQGVEQLRKAMSKQITSGKMIGGQGWTAKHVREFFGGAEFYGIPCSATAKDGIPLGRIVHDYGYYHPEGSYSVNATHSCTSVKFLSLFEVSSFLDQVEI